MSFDLSDYVDVAERTHQFYEKHADGRIQADPVQIVQLADRTFLSVVARVYRSETDPIPCVAQAWEPFPGSTPYTRNSEAMNAETSAIGRALGAAGIGSRRSLASREEVAARQAERDIPPARQAQTKKAMALFTELGLKDRDDRLAFTAAVLDRDVPSWKSVNTDEADRVIASLESRKAHQDGDQ